MFIPLQQNPVSEQVDILINGESVQVAKGISAAAALLKHGLKANRQSLVSGNQRGPYCMMGVCFECLVEINGIANQQACMTQVEEGMSIRKQSQYRLIALPQKESPLFYDVTNKELSNAI